MLKKAIKLNMNEVPYLPPKEIIAAAKKGLKNLNRYSDPENLERLRGLLADYAGVSKKHIILSPGSDLLLREIIHTLSKGRKITMVSPSFLPTVHAAKQFATKLLGIRLSPPDFDLNVNLLLDQLTDASARRRAQAPPLLAEVFEHVLSATVLVGQGVDGDALEEVLRGPHVDRLVPGRCPLLVLAGLLDLGCYQSRLVRREGDRGLIEGPGRSARGAKDAEQGEE